MTQPDKPPIEIPEQPERAPSHAPDGHASAHPHHHPEPYIAFEHVYKALASNVVLDDVSYYALPREVFGSLGRCGRADDQRCGDEGRGDPGQQTASVHDTAHAARLGGRAG